MIKLFIKLSACLLLALTTTSCVHLKEYQKSRIKDSEMALANRKIERNELSFQSYVESSSGANAGRTGGGCGCN